MRTFCKGIENNPTRVRSSQDAVNMGARIVRGILLIFRLFVYESGLTELVR